MTASPEKPTLTIRFSPMKLLLIFVPLAILVGISMALDFDAWRRAEAWVYWCFGGIVAFLVFACVVMPRQYYLRLSSEGLRVNYVFWHRFYSWNEMRNFRIGSQDMQGPAWAALVVFDLSEDSPHRSTLVRMASALNKYDVSIMATFNRSADEIVELLHLWHEQHGKAARPAELAPDAPEPSQEPHA